MSNLINHGMLTNLISNGMLINPISNGITIKGTNLSLIKAINLIIKDTNQYQSQSPIKIKVIFCDKFVIGFNPNGVPNYNPHPHGQQPMVPGQPMPMPNVSAGITLIKNR